MENRKILSSIFWSAALGLAYVVGMIYGRNQADPTPKNVESRPVEIRYVEAPIVRQETNKGLNLIEHLLTGPAGFDANNDGRLDKEEQANY